MNNRTWHRYVGSVRTLKLSPRERLLLTSLIAILILVATGEGIARPHGYHHAASFLELLAACVAFSRLAREAREMMREWSNRRAQ